MHIFVKQKHDISTNHRFLFKYEKCFRRKCTPAGKVVRIYHVVNRAIALFYKPFKNTWKSIEKVNPENRILLIALPIVLPIHSAWNH